MSFVLTAGVACVLTKHDCANVAGVWNVRHQMNVNVHQRNHELASAAQAALRSGRQLQEWWRRTEDRQSYAERFSFIRTFNAPETCFGFFDAARIDGCLVPVLGQVEDTLFDHPKTSAIGTYQRQMREFVMRYMMRVSDFRRPSAYVNDVGVPSNHEVGGLSWCPDPTIEHEGFGYSQWLYKPRDSDKICDMPADRRFEIVDLREIGTKYDWIVARVRIFNFTVKFRPFGNDAPEVQIPLEEDSYLVVSPDFIVDDSQSVVEPGGRRVVGRYGFGYAFVKQPPGSLLGYGPGEFDVAFQQIQFRIYEDGETRVQLVFVANRPTRIANVPIAPLDWPVRIANAATFGIGAAFLNPLSEILGQMSAPLGRCDPVATYSDWANALMAGRAAERLCVSREQLEKAFLVQHFRQHYDMMTGALQTWRRIADWTDEGSLPEWVRTGVSS